MFNLKVLLVRQIFLVALYNSNFPLHVTLTLASTIHFRSFILFWKHNFHISFSSTCKFRILDSSFPTIFFLSCVRTQRDNYFEYDNVFERKVIIAKLIWIFGFKCTILNSNFRYLNIYLSSPCTLMSTLQVTNNKNFGTFWQLTIVFIISAWFWTLLDFRSNILTCPFSSFIFL